MPYATGNVGGPNFPGPSLSDIQKLIGQKNSGGGGHADIQALLQQFLGQQQQGNFNGFEGASLVPVSQNAGNGGTGIPGRPDVLGYVAHGLLSGDPNAPEQYGLGRDITTPADQPKQSAEDAAIQALVGKLPGLIDGGMSQADFETALKNSDAAINSGFGAQMNAVRAASNNAKHTTAKNSKKIDAMYRALSKDYATAANDEVARADQYTSKIKGVTKHSEQAVQGNADQILNQQAALAQGLGVESATPNIQSTQKDQVHKQVAAIEGRGQRDLNDTLRNSQTQEQFLAREGVNSGYAGAEMRGNLLQQLEGYLQGNQGKIADLKGALSQALLANEDQLRAAMSSSNDKAFGQSLDVVKFLESVKNDKIKNSKSSATDPITGLLSKSDQLSQLLNGQTGNPQLLNDFLLTDPAVQNGTWDTTDKAGNVTHHNTTAAKVMSEAYAWAKKNHPELSADQLTAFANAAVQASKGLK